MPPLCFAYYCSGHGYGHATRVSAFACHLLNLPAAERPIIHITSSAPKHVFSDSIALGALYRYAEIDPVIVQPLAYRVDRQKSVDVLKSFLSRKDSILETERKWLQDIGAHAVLSDAAFLGCYLATPLLQVDLLEGQTQGQGTQANRLAPINTKGTSQTSHFANYKDTFTALLPDIPILSEELAPLVSQIHEGYRCADLLLLLPGFIPIPSFEIYPSLPAPTWVDVDTNSFHPDIIEALSRSSFGSKLHPSVPLRSSPSPSSSPAPVATPRPPATQAQPRPPGRSVIKAPLLVRPPNPDVYTTQGRARLLASIGVPPDLHDPAKTRILVVSFGGQVFRAPRSRSSTRTSRSQSRSGTPIPMPVHAPAPRRKSPSPPSASSSASSSVRSVAPVGMRVNGDDQVGSAHANGYGYGYGATLYPDALAEIGLQFPAPHHPQPLVPPRLATPSHIWIPGAPPASKPHCHSRTTSVSSVGAPESLTVPELTTIPPSPKAAPMETTMEPEVFSLEYDEVVGQDLSPGADVDMGADGDEDEDDGVRLLPDESWIAIVCGASKEQWANIHLDQQSASTGSSTTVASEGMNLNTTVDANGGDFGLPEGFYVAPKDVYMPDLTAVGDVLLGKLGYGTVSECVDALSRPLFIEEHGLRLLLDKEGVGAELSRQSYEAGDWACAVEDAWARGRGAKERKRAEGLLGIGVDEKKEEGVGMAWMVVEWAKGGIDN
ncbi:hypothetical protein H0H92_009415 [Tricholoma furcatifolium]|nr:hypothetical protein H0H92_009415 [Tricholoma furcatifolium]